MAQFWRDTRYIIYVRSKRRERVSDALAIIFLTWHYIWKTKTESGTAEIKTNISVVGLLSLYNNRNTITYDYEPRTAAAAAALDAVAADLIKNSHSPGYVVQSTALLRRLVC